MNRKEIIYEIGRLEDKLERCPELEDEINQQIRKLGKKLESFENPLKKDIHAPKKSFKTRKRLRITKEELEELLKDHTAAEIARMFGVHRETISRYKSKWKIGRKGA